MEKKGKGRGLKRALLALAAAVSCVLTAGLLVTVAMGTGSGGPGSVANSSSAVVMDRFDTYIDHVRSDALAGVVTIEKVYWLSDEDLIAPVPDPACYGQTDDTSTLGWLLEAAEEELGITDTLFSTDVEIFKGTQVTYYLDETILVITWKQVFHNSIYTFSEVKIAHPSQIRRFLADGTYGADKQYYPSEMAAAVNAVTASSGDFYKYRELGICVYQGTVYRAKDYLDTCYIDEEGNMLFTLAGELGDEAAVRQFVEENNVRFSLAFGPVLIEDGQVVVPHDYLIGEPRMKFARMALCQMGELHYLLVATNQEENSYKSVPTTENFAKQLAEFGCVQAYCLDGGQTAAIITNNQLINRPAFGFQRQISDIIYFATAIPNGE